MKTFNHITHGPVMLGLDRAQFFKLLPSSDYVKAQAIASPPAWPAWAWERPNIDWGMLGNDTVGDCVIAWMFHHTMGWKSVTGVTPTFTTDQALSIYSAITGYNPADPNTDQGTDPAVALTYWMNTGILGDKIAGSVSVDITNLDAIKGLSYLMGGLGVSLQVPQYVFQVPAGGSWSETPGADTSIAGEHQVYLCGRGSAGWRFVSWGTTYTASWDFWGKYVLASQAVVSPDWIEKSGKSPTGLDLNGLLADLSL